ncbi:MAG: TIGR03986 family CRISPR-associated RAMP protein [Desulfobulbaceae bacterium]|nr:TIGR03986 family CRISPR-associated RAMP protein [Desulfobulbaceae bacterium]
MAFHNPYHFVPALEPRVNDNTQGWLTKTQFESHEHCGTHDRYHPDTYSGRIVCRLTTVSPIFIGADRSKGDEKHPSVAKHFELNDQPAIPATSLRGLISSVAEAASSSSLRVLENRLLTHRKDMDKSLSALGMVFVEQNESGKKSYSLQPIAMPTLKGKKENGRFRINNDFQRFHQMFCLDGDKGSLQPRLKVYITPSRNKIPDPHEQGKFLCPRSYRADAPEYFYMNLRRDWHFTKDFHLADTHLIRQPSRKGGKEEFVIGQIARDDNPAPLILHQDDPRVDPTTMVRGILRILSGGMRREEMPPNKKHEFFIPYPEGAEQWRKFPIPRHVVDVFHTLADERTETEKEKSLPFEPIGTLRNDNGKPGDCRFQLKTGDIVYFDVESSGEVSEIALSSIWRGSPMEKNPQEDPRPSRVFDFFRAIDKELLPFGAGREFISPAEQLFGFVQEVEGGKEAKSNTDTLAFKSRVRFSHALVGDDQNGDMYLPEVTLKILASPKPPSPNMYFKNANVEKAYIKKSNLEAGIHHPQGRKFYLHHRKRELQNTTNPPWKTIHDDKHSKQKVKIKPVAEGKTFWFHVDFENLDGYQLGMLCYGLQPSEEFHHKIGMGKPLGLGSICIEPVVFSLINRRMRYMEGNPFDENTDKYHCCRIYNDNADKLPPRYEGEIRGVGYAKRDFLGFRDEFAARVQPEVKRALELLGPIDSATSKVHTPLAEGQTDMEEETFKWFVNNDNKFVNKRQTLEPINSGTLQQLDRNFIIKK